MLSRDEALAVTLSIAVALLVAAFAIIASATAVSQAPSQGSAPGPSCAEWTDSCVVCRRVPEGLACSTPGIACVPSAPRCLRPAGVPI
ncbi:hypothetical protein [Microvirga terrestris]|uniref:Uncharacterized protein n=1 Tax=Microvirga terrestris TaxID=2791024 RepID=A0ABS0HU41_9HYPH|nr:hypothetical protein [Microvirga terrestris]MBF9197021.1 hypothetical protein [Microvirga terrestris]